MSIGTVLATARARSGLTVSEVSRRTRIGEAVIWGIERDDYSACGGDFYARGHIRAIARAVGVDPGPLIQQYDATLRTTKDITETVVLHPATPSGIRKRHRVAWAAALGLAVLAVLGLAADYLVSGTGHALGGGAVAAVGRAGVAHHQADHSKPRPVPGATHSAAARVPHVVPARALPSVSAVALSLDPDDNLRNAAPAIDGDPATAWRTDWFTTADFGNLQPGTGLLLDMGRPVTVTAAQITLGDIPGASLQLRVGNVPALADLRQVAGATDVGGVVRLRPTVVAPARYVLIWFTRLPPDTSGTFQASVYDVRLEGQP